MQSFHFVLCHSFLFLSFLIWGNRFIVRSFAVLFLRGCHFFLWIGARWFRLSELLHCSGSGAVFALGRKTEEFRETRFVSLTRRTPAIRLDPFGMFLAQGFVYLLLKVNVRLDGFRNRCRSLHFHWQHGRR